MNPDLSIVTVSFNAADALALMRESWLRYHPNSNARWIVYDNGSTDGALEYAKAHADLVLEGDNSMSHGERISNLLKQVDTPLVLHIDNDIEVHAPVYPMMVDGIASNPKAYCSCLTRLYYPGCQTWLPPEKWEQDYPYGTFDVYGKIWKGMWSPNIAVGLMRMDVVQRIHDLGIGFGYYACDAREEWYETGGMAYLFARAMGFDVVEMPELWGRVTHFGSISTLWTGAGDDPVMQERYDRVKKRLAILRAETANV